MYKINFVPRLYQDTILETIKKSNTLTVLGTGLGKCLEYNQPILLSNNSLIKVGELVENQIKTNKLIKNSKDHLVSSNPNKIKIITLNEQLRLEEKEIEQFHKIKNKYKLIKIISSSGREIITTPEHPFLTINPKNELEWVSINNLKTGSFIATPRKLSIINKTQKLSIKDPFTKISRYCKVKYIYTSNQISGIKIVGSKSRTEPIKALTKTSPNLFYLIGLIIAEARLYGGTRFFNTDITLLEEFTKLSKKVFGISPTKIDGGLLLSSTALYYFLKYYFNLENNQHSKNKTISDTIFKGTNEEISHFIAGFFDGEGHIRKGDHVLEISSASKDLINKLSYLFLRFEIYSIISKKIKWATNGKKIKRDYYQLNISCQSNLIKFYNQIPIKHPSKIKTLKTILAQAKKENKNKDIIPLNKTIRTIRQNLNLSSSDYKDFNLSSIRIYERGERSFTDNSLSKVINSFENHLIQLKKRIKFYQILKNSNNKSNNPSKLLKIAETLRIATKTSKFKLKLIFKTSFLPTTKSKPERIIKYLQEIVKIYETQLEQEQKIKFLKTILNSDIYWDRIKSIEEQESDWVYDLSIKDTHNFIAGFNGGFIAHNTKLAIQSSIHRLNLYPDTKILFLTPTKPLANQITEEFKTSTDIRNITLFTGETNPDLREQLIQTSKVIVSTPQTISNDIVNNRINLNEFSLLVIDEAHRAVKNYDYVWITKQYKKLAIFPRILGLTASPGSDLETIKEICKNLYIEDIEVRTEEDPDVKPYIQELKKEYIYVDLPPEYQEIKSFLDQSFNQRLVSLKSLNLITKTKPSKTELLKQQAQIQRRIAMGQKDVRMWQGISLLAQVIKILHSQELLETQGLLQFNKYITSLFESAETTKVKAVKNLTQDLNIKSAHILARNLIDKKIEHPKLTKLKSIINNELKLNPEIRVIIFTQFRDTAKILETELPSSRLFVGQMKKDGTGMSQKEQIKTLQEFTNSKFNILIGTSVSEEGIDIPKVDLVIFYEPIPSAIRSLQRRGRTARVKEGKVIILITSKTRDETSHWIANNKEKKMYQILYNLKNKIKIEDQPKLQEFSKQEYEILVDSRETSSQTLKELSNQGFKIQTKTLDIGDYVLSEDLAIERKTQEDFLRSIIDKRILPQIQNLKKSYKKPLLILEGNNDIYSLTKIHPNSIRGMLTTINLIYNIPIIYTKNPKDTAEYILTLAKQLKQDSKYFGILPTKKPLTLQKQQEYIISSLPGIGPKLATLLLQKFKTIENIINAKEQDLETIPKLGKIKINKIKSLLKEEYKET